MNKRKIKKKMMRRYEYLYNGITCRDMMNIMSEVMKKDPNAVFYGGDELNESYFLYETEETDKEYEDRLKREAYFKQKTEEKKEIDERKVYERLKKKFEGQ